jgi:hypothetical protein
MSTPDYQIHRGVVQYSDASTGMSKVRIPALLGADDVVDVPSFGLTYKGGRWNVPPIGTSVYVAVAPDRTEYLWLTAIGVSGSGGDDPSNEPIGHEDRTDSVMSFNASTQTFSIQPVGASYVVWCVGQRYEKTSLESIQIPDETGLYYISFDAQGQLQYSTTYFVWDQDCPTAYVYYNTSPTPSMYMLFDERHGITMDWQTHEYLHRTRGAAIANGFTLDGRLYDESVLSTLDGSEDEHAQIGITYGTFFDEDLKVDITHSDSPEANTWQQYLDLPTNLPILYRFGYSEWRILSSSDFPMVKADDFGSTTRTVYNSSIITVGGLYWLREEMGNGDFGVTWIVATNQLSYPVVGIMGQATYSNIGQAEAVDWQDLYLEGLPIVELRPLHKVIFDTRSYVNSINAVIQKVEDIRKVEPGILD